MLTSILRKELARGKSALPLRTVVLATGAAIVIVCVGMWGWVGAAAGEKWVASWGAAQHGPYPSGNATAGPDLSFAFPDPISQVLP